MNGRSFYRIMAGPKSAYFNECLEEEFIGADFSFRQDLSPFLADDHRQFNKRLTPEFLELNPDKSKVAGALACGMLHTVCKIILQGDIILCPDREGSYAVGEVTGSYFYVDGDVLPHRRAVKWHNRKIPRSSMSQALQYSAGSIGTVSNISKYDQELESLISNKGGVSITVDDDSIEDPSIFAMEKHLEDFLIVNWDSCELGKTYDILTDEDKIVGQQFPTDTGYIDILAISKDRRELLVIELKKGRASDAAVGQTLRYIGYVREEIAEKDQIVRGCIIALENDKRIKRALMAVDSIDFYRYEISFELKKS